ncbi:MAG: PP2C family protein-serine/threonine phosphatase [Acidimicrobiales bacterium]
MIDSALMADNEPQRLAAVRRYDILDTPPDGAFERVTAVAARLFDVPVAIVSIVDEDRIWFKSHHGVDVDQIGRDPGLCASAILGRDPWLVGDAKTDPRALANPLVAGSFGLRFYAGVPLRTHDGFNLGTLCVIDREPRAVTDDEVATLEDLAAVVMDELELRLSARRAVELESEMRRQAERVASELQESLIPPALPALPGLEVVSRYHVAHRDRVGGDFFDVVPTPSGAALFVGDACGKGTPTAALAGIARWTLHTLLVDGTDPADALSRLNGVLCGPQAGLERYVTSVAARVSSTATGADTTTAVGGNPLPLVLRADGMVEALGAGGPIIGWDDASRYRSTTAALGHGDVLVLFTDGLLESIAGRGETDDASVRSLLRPLGGRSAEEVARALDAAMSVECRDDAAFLVARVG